MDKPSAQAVMEAAGISRTHAYDIIAKREAPSLAVAFKIYDATGERFGLLDGLDQITVEKLRPKAAA